MSSSDEQPDIPSPSTSFDAYQIELQSAAVSAVKRSVALPKDISYHRSLDRKFGKQIDDVSNRILALTSKLLDYAEAANDVEGAPDRASSKNKGKRKLETEEDVVDDFHSRVVDVLDQLLERTDSCLDQYLGRTKAPAIPINPKAEAKARLKVIKSQSGRLDPSITHASHLPKPQLHFRTPVDNKSILPWRPTLKSKPHAIISLEDSLGDNNSALSPHPYQYEIANFSPPSHLLTAPSSPTPPESLESSPPVTYISHVSQLPDLLETLKQANEIAVDLEHHSYRSFAGFVCLMQISTRTQDWIVDCLDPAIRVELECLNEVFANPNIVKVFHGAESDIVWLEQNFNIFVVNLFDTYHASKVLEFPKHSLAALLEMFCDFTPDKRYQLADWRIRPLPQEMLNYARSDTHFLLYIYDNLRNALNAPRTPPPQMQAASPLLEVIKRSNETALRIYVKEIYDEKNGTGPGGWEALSRKWNKSFWAGASVRGNVFRAVHRWRDMVARNEDESTRYVLPNHYLFNIAERPPSDLPALLAIFQPVSPLVRVRSLELLDVIKEAVKRAGLEQQRVEVAEDVEMKVADVNKDMRVVGAVAEKVKSDLWDRLRPLSTNITSSSALFGSIPTTDAAYSTQKSSLLGSSAPSDAADNKRFQEITARIHSTLVLAPTLPKAVTQPKATSSSTVELKVIPQPSPDPAVVAEISYVPAAQRQTAKSEIVEDDGIIVVGQRQTQKKRKRKDKVKDNDSTDSPAPSDAKKRKSDEEDEDTADVMPFDFSTAPNILDDPNSSSAAPAKKKREKRAPTVQYGNFGPAPKNLSEMKGGNQSKTFG
ncbi:hypothetical protein M422DRAFT_775114 [Sphaerobolus stellatus SS14]|nr:hypothetical protein M422DRAFT_775114 [Sphaerobolus stellatus SS14]